VVYVGKGGVADDDRKKEGGEGGGKRRRGGRSVNREVRGRDRGEEELEMVNRIELKRLWWEEKVTWCEKKV